MTDTNNSIAQRHAGFHTSEETIFDLIKEHIGCTPLKRTKIVRGYDSEVYDVATKEGDSFIVKIKHYGEISYGQEQWAIDMCRNVGVPVPRILLHKLGHQMGHLAHELREGMKPEAEIRTKKLRETLRNLTNLS
jgi:hypothetical protein